MYPVLFPIFWQLLKDHNFTLSTDQPPEERTLISSYGIAQQASCCSRIRKVAHDMDRLKWIIGTRSSAM